MKPNTRIAVIGVGYMGMRHAKIYRSLQNTELCAVVDIDLEKCMDAEKQLKVPSYHFIHQLINHQQVDGVSICVPAKFHKMLTLECFDQNLSVLLEKPFAASVAEAKQILQAAQDKLLLVGHVERFNPAIQVLKEQLNQQVIGEIFYCKFIRRGLLPNQTCQSVGIHYDLTIHDLDLLPFLFDSKPKIERVHQYSKNQLSTLLHIGQIEVELLTEWGSFQERLIQIKGSMGQLDVNLLTQEVNLTTSLLTKKLPIVPKNALELQLRHFVDCIQRQEKPKTTPLEALEAVQLAAQLEPLVSL